MLSIDGPLRRLPAAQLDALGERLLAMVEQGLSSGAGRSVDDAADGSSAADE